MGRKMKRLANAAITLAAVALVEKAISMASDAARNRKARRKATDVGKAIRKGATSTARTTARKAVELKEAAEKQVPVMRERAAKQLEKLARIAAP